MILQRPAGMVGQWLARGHTRTGPSPDTTGALSVGQNTQSRKGHLPQMQNMLGVHRNWPRDVAVFSSNQLSFLLAICSG